MIANVRCNKCQVTGGFDVGSDVTTIEQAQEVIDAANIQSCPWGNHVELSPISYTVLSIEEGSAKSDEDVLAEMNDKGLICWTDTGDLKDAGVDITSFAYGMPIANINGHNFNLDFTSLPSGRRVYYGNRSVFDKIKAA